MVREIDKINHHGKMYINAYLKTTNPSHQNEKFLFASFFSYCTMVKASAMATSMVASIIDIIKQCRYYNHTGYKILEFKLIAKGEQL